MGITIKEVEEVLGKFNKALDCCDVIEYKLQAYISMGK